MAYCLVVKEKREGKQSKTGRHTKTIVNGNYHGWPHDIDEGAAVKK